MKRQYQLDRLSDLTTLEVDRGVTGPSREIQWDFIRRRLLAPTYRPDYKQAVELFHPRQVSAGCDAARDPATSPRNRPLAKLE
jgi:hypothetical protein